MVVPHVVGIQPVLEVNARAISPPASFSQRLMCYDTHHHEPSRPPCPPGAPALNTSTPADWSAILDRRDLLRVGAVGLASSVLPNLAAATAQPRRATAADSIIVLWMAGGLTHIDSFDPKPDAPPEIRGTLRGIPTSVPGIQF